MIICPKCQTSNEIGQETCVACGSELPVLNEQESAGPTPQNHSNADEVDGMQPHLPEEDVELSPDEEVDWLEELKQVTAPLESGQSSVAKNEDLPDWAQESVVEPVESGNSQLLGWLQDDETTENLVGEKVEPEVPPVDSSGTAADSDIEESSDQLEMPAGAEIQESGEEDPSDSGLQIPQTAELPGTMPLESHHELEDLPEQLAKEELPEWMADDELPPRVPEVTEGIENAAAVPGLEDLIDEVAALGQEESSFFGEESTADSEADGILITDLPPNAPEWLVEIMDESAENREFHEADWDDVEAVISQNLPESSELSEDVELEEEASPIDEAVALTAAAIAAKFKIQPEDASADSDQSEEEAAAAIPTPEIQEDIAEADQLIAMLDELPEGEAESDIVGATLANGKSVMEDEIPDWLQSIEPETLVGGGFDPVSPAVEADGPLAGLTGVIPVTATLSISKTQKTETQYQLSKEQKQQIAILERLTHGEQTQTVAGKSDQRNVSSTLFRLVTATILLAVILVGLYLPSLEDFVSGSANVYVPEGAEGAFEVTEALGSRPALVAFEYTPAMAGELDIVAGAYLQHLSEQNSPVITISQVAAGVPMAERMVEQVGISQHLPLGLLPGEATGVRYLGTCMEQSVECDLIRSQELGSDVGDTLAQVGLIIVLAADRESLVSWIEQVGSQSDVPIVAGVTQAMGPIASPFLASGQLVGNLDGLPGAAAYESQLGNTSGVASDLLSSTILAQWMIILALAGSSIYFGLQAVRQKSRR
jgi:hypothetical protein